MDNLLTSKETKTSNKDSNFHETIINSNIFDNIENEETNNKKSKKQSKKEKQKLIEEAYFNNKTDSIDEKEIENHNNEEPNKLTSKELKILKLKEKNEKKQSKKKSKNDNKIDIDEDKTDITQNEKEIRTEKNTEEIPEKQNKKHSKEHTYENLDSNENLCYLDKIKKLSYAGILLYIQPVNVIKLLNMALSYFNDNYKDKNISLFLEHFSEPSFPKMSKWRFPKDFHITCLFYNGKHVKQTEAYTSFVGDINYDIIIKGLIFIPDKIVTLIVKPDEVKIQNNYPHVTALLNDYKAIDSNLVCETLFQEGKLLEKEYKIIIDSNSTEKVSEIVEVTIKGKKETAYVYKFNNLEIVKGISKVYLN